MKNLKILAAMILLAGVFTLAGCVHKTTPVPDPEGKASCERQLEQIGNPDCACVYREGWVVDCAN